MNHTINFDGDFVSQEEMHLIETKHAILEKLRLKFGAIEANKAKEIIPIQRDTARPQI
jgi:hypothetical protein